MCVIYLSLLSICLSIPFQTLTVQTWEMLVCRAYRRMSLEETLQDNCSTGSIRPSSSHTYVSCFSSFRSSCLNIDSLPNTRHDLLEALSSSCLDGYCRLWLGDCFNIDGINQDSTWLGCKLTMGQGTGFSFGGLLTARVFLGVFEAGFAPSIPLYFCSS